MGYNSKVSLNAREQLDKFLGIFYPRFSIPKMKFLRQMLYGIQATKSVILNRIAAEIDEETTQKKIEDRLSHHLAHEVLWTRIHEAVLGHAKRFIRRDTLIVIDPSDIQKPYAKKMPYLAKVWDGSRGEVGENLGYWGCMAIACERGSHRVVPLQFRLWSTEDPECKGETEEIKAIVDSIRKAVGNRGIYVYDRGGDRNEIFRYFIEHGLAFIVRMMRKRYLVHNGERVNILVLAAMCHTPHRSEVEFNAQGEDKPTKISYGAIPVRLPEDPDHPGMHEKDLRLVVVRGFGQTAMLILTSIPGDGSKGGRVAHRPRLPHAVARRGDDSVREAVLRCRGHAHADAHAAQEPRGVRPRGRVLRDGVDRQVRASRGPAHSHRRGREAHLRCA